MAKNFLKVFKAGYRFLFTRTKSSQDNKNLPDFNIFSVPKA